MPGVTKLSIQAYLKADLSGKCIGTYTAQVNPEKYSLRHEMLYDVDGPLGSSNVTPKFKRALPGTMDFELLFDGTGVIETQSERPYDVAKELALFRRVAARYNGSIHQPNYLMLTWGQLKFPCRLKSLSVNYTLFAPSGKPLRARATVSFTNAQDNRKITAREDKQSPDVTHRVRVQAGDTLPGLTGQVYGDSRYYLQVARHNHLIDFRALKTGRELEFPALKT